MLTSPLELIVSIEADYHSLLTAEGINETRLYERIGNTYLSMKKYSKAVECYWHALKGGLDDPQFIDKFSRTLGATEEYATAQTLLEKALAHYTEKAPMARLNVSFAYLMNLAGANAPSMKYCDVALGLLPAHGTVDRDILAEARFLKGWALNNLGRSDEALGFFEGALEIYQDIKDPTGLADTYQAMGMTYFNKTEFNRAWNCFERSNAAKDQSYNYIYLGLIKQAEKLLRTSLEKSIITGQFKEIPGIQLNRVMLSLDMNDIMTAKERLKDTEQRMKDLNIRGLAFQVDLMQARIAFKEGDLKKAWDIAEDLSKTAIKYELTTIEPQCYVLQGDISAANGDYTSAKTLLAKAIDQHRMRGQRLPLGRTLVKLAKVFTALHEKAGASQCVEAAQILYTEMDLEHELAKLEKLSL
jgi:tetratricopeptide (TPR) repeat protein